MLQILLSAPLGFLITYAVFFVFLGCKLGYTCKKEKKSNIHKKDAAIS
jgi:hypothetical protein